MPWSTVTDNVLLPFRLAGRIGPRQRERAGAEIQSVGLAGFERAYPRQLSGGMRMRVSIARALVTDPDLLLLDEPFAALDEITRMALNDDLMRLWESRRPTVVFVTHSVFESVYLSTRIAVMTPRPGHILAELPVGLPQPRQRSLRTSPHYAALCAAVSDQLVEQWLLSQPDYIASASPSPPTRDPPALRGGARPPRIATSRTARDQPERWDARRKTVMQAGRWAHRSAWWESVLLALWEIIVRRGHTSFPWPAC